SDTPKKVRIDSSKLINAIEAAGLADKALINGDPDLSNIDASEKVRVLEFLGDRVIRNDPYRTMLDLATSYRTNGVDITQLEVISALNSEIPIINAKDLYIRQEYPSLYSLILERFETSSPIYSNQNRIMVTGTPGIGKSAFLVYFTIRLLTGSTDEDPP
ncbi:hypothetical protein BGZ76_007651, partial [Entomortierella beljakovae]